MHFLHVSSEACLRSFLVCFGNLLYKHPHNDLRQLMKQGLLTMNLDDYDAIYRAAIQKWGRDAQFEQLVEECAELITAVKHYQRNKVSEQGLAEELADVLLMAGQMIYMLGEERVQKAVETKITKLATLLEQPVA